MQQNVCNLHLGRTQFAYSAQVQVAKLLLHPGLVHISNGTYTACADCNLQCVVVVVSWKWYHGMVACGGCI